LAPVLNPKEAKNPAGKILLRLIQISLKIAAAVFFYQSEAKLSNLILM